MFTPSLTLRSKVLVRLTLLLAAGCLLGALLSNFTASASSSEPGLLRRFFTAPVTTVQQVFGRVKSLAATPVSVPAAPAMAATITVNSLADTVADDGTCTLREAITSANNNTASGAMAGECAAGMAGLDNIVFNLAAGTPSIALTGALPNIVAGEPVNINGNTGASTRVELNCTLVPAGLNGLTIFAGSSTVQSLVINRLPDKNSKGIYLTANGGNTVKNCYIGTNAAGTAISANGGDGVFINNVPDNIVGGTTAAERNIISGNGSVTVVPVVGPPPSSYIEKTGNGVSILGCDPADINCVLNAKGNKVLGNYIGTDVTGMTALLNIESGVVIRHGSDNIVDRNLISGNGFDGIFIQAPQSTGNKVTGNFIGVNVTGTAAIGNLNDGVLLSNAPNNIIGGTTAAERNIISGNSARGIWIFEANASGNKVIGNYVGTDVTGTVDIHNGTHGVVMQNAPNNWIGGTAPAEANIVAFHTALPFDPNIGQGVNVRVVPAGTGITAKGNRILGNSIFGSGLRGIALSVDNAGPYPNDPMDADTGDDLTSLPPPFTNRGGNNLQNYPVLSCAVSGVGTTTIKGTLNSLATTKFRVEFFSNDACHATGNGEGKTYLGFQNVTTDAAGNATINASVAATVAPGKFITSTATKLDDTDAPIETSEFSACQIVTTAPTLAINNVTQIEGNAGSANFVFTVTLSAASSCGDVTVSYATADGSATTANNDYTTTTGMLTFTGATLTQTISVPVTGDLVAELDEAFVVNLSNASGAGIATAQGTGTITNDDTVKTLAINDVTVTEGDSGTINANFNVTLSAAHAAPITVQYQTADGTANTPSDYAALALTTLTFNAGETTKPVTVVVNGDTTVEANETFFVNLSNASGATIADPQGVGTITNDDSTTIAINDVTVAEGDSGTVNANFNVTLSKPSATPVTVQYQTADGTATTPSDYAALALTTLTFNIGETTKPVTVVVNGDMTVEGNETFFVNLSNASGATINDAQGIGIISNDDATTIAINDITVAEGDSGTVNANFNVTLSKPSATAVTVQYQTADNTATAPSDYAALALATLTFNAGETTKPVTVVVNGDTTVEATETFFVNLSNASGATIADAQGIGTISNDDATTIAINDVTVAEGDSGTVNAGFNVTLSKPSATPVTVQYQTADNSATAPSDYAALALATLTFNPGETTKPVTVVVNGDTTVEPTESFFVNLSNASGATIADAQGVGTITNDDSTTIAINDVTVAEGDSGTVNANFNVTLSKPSATPVTVQYQTADDTATAPSDYAALALATLTFNPGETTKPVTVVVNGDLTSEATETFFVNLSNASGATIADAQGVGTITNDDIAKTLAISDVTVTEGDSGTVNAVFNVTLNAPHAAPITVQYQTADNSATAPSDYTALALATLTFNAGETTKPVTVVVNGDMTVEGNETFFVNLSNASGATINDAQGVGTITNDDSTTVAITDVTVTEGNSGTVNANFNVTLSKPSATPVTVQYQTADNSATAPSDYTALALATLTFNAGETTKPVTVVVNGDTTVEANETFFVNLSNASGATIADAQGIGTINNDDSPTVAITDVTVTEGNSGTVNATFNVTLSAASASAVTVQYQTANDTATAPSDYAALALTTLTFNAGETTKPVTVVVNGDTTVEGNETFFVNLSNASGATIADAQGVGTITNDDSPTVAINDVTVTEGNSGTINATFNVTLSAASASSVTVQYQTANDSATAPSDYAALALTTLTFNAGETTKPVTVVVNGDTTVEPTEQFFVNLSNASGATIADAQGVGTITNDDTTTVAINDVTVTEGNSGTVSASFTVTLSKPSAEQVTVSYAAANGTATTGDNDYAAASGTVIFAAGETSKPVAVTVNGDTKVEANETFNVNLSNIVGNNVNVPDPTMGDALGVGTITNDDAATVAINDVTVTEGHSGTVNASFAVSLSAPVDQPVVVNYATANGTATIANGDYAAATGTVTFAAGSTAAQTITVLVNGDTNIEPDETFVVNLTPNSLPYAGVTIADAQGLGTIKTDDFDKTPSLNVAMNDPFVCNGIGSSIQVTAQLNNPFPSAQAATFSVTLPSMLTALPGTCTATTGNCTITLPNQISWAGTLNPDQTVTITYQAQIADGTPDGQLIVINSKGTVNGVDAQASASGTVSCPANNLNSPPTDVDVSAQKPGSVLIYPYYTSKSGTKADTRIQLSNVGKSQIIAHLFFVDGTSCQQSDMFICLTPDASFSFKASEYDPEVTGWFMVVAVDTNGHPTQNNGLIGSAFVQDGDYVDSYGAEAFWARSGNLATVTANTALLRFDGAGYDPMPNQFAVELQSPLDTVGQRIVTVGLSGDLTTSRMTGAGQLGLGLAYNGNENPFGSFGSFLVGNCQAIATISTTNPRVPGAMSKLIPSGQVGTMKFNIGAGVGLLMTPRTAPNKWSGIRALHKTNTTFSTIRIPVFTPQC